MRFLANENFPGVAVMVLRAAGHDVAWGREDNPGIADQDVLAWAVREARVLLTFDKDFGELAWHARLPADCGVILFRLPMPRPPLAGQILAEIVTARDDWRGCFSVVESGRLRMRPMPT